MPIFATAHEAAECLVYSYLTADGEQTPAEALASLQARGIVWMLTELDGMGCCLDLDPETIDVVEQIEIKRAVLDFATWRAVKQRLQLEVSGGSAGTPTIEAPRAPA